MGGGGWTEGSNTVTQSVQTSVLRLYTYFIYKDNITSEYVAIKGIDASELSRNLNCNTVFTAVINAMSSGGVLLLGAGQFDVAAEIVANAVGNGTAIKGLGKDVTIINLLGTSTGDVEVFSIQGTANSVPHNLNAVAKGDTVLTYTTISDVNNYAVGDDILVMNDTIIDSEIGGRNEGELHTITAINAGAGQITLDVPMRYAQTTTPRTYKINFKKNIEIRDLTFTTAATSSVATKTKGAVFFKYVKGLWLYNVKFTKMFRAQLEIFTCWHGATDLGCEFIDGQADTATTRYAISVRGATTDFDFWGTANNHRHSWTYGAGSTNSSAGRCELIRVYMKSLRTDTAHFDCHLGAGLVEFIGCIADGYDPAASGNPCGFQTRSKTTFKECTVRNCKRGFFIFRGAVGEAGGSNSKILNCVVQDLVGANSDAVRSDPDMDGVIIDGLVISNIGGRVIETGSTGNDNWIVKNVTADTTNTVTAGGSILLGTTTGFVFEDCNLKNNASAAGKPFDTGASTGVTIKDGKFNGNTSNTPTFNTDAGHKLINNQGYNDAGLVVTNPFAAGAGDVRNTSQTNAAPASTTNQTIRHSPKEIKITGGTVTAVIVNGVTVAAGTNVRLVLDVGDVFSITHSVAPTVTVTIR